MPIVAHNDLPAYTRLRNEGMTVLTPDRAHKQDIRDLHFGLLNMMPDAALAATERQFFRLVGESNPIAQFYLHPFTIAEINRGTKAQAHIDEFYESFETLQEQGLDGLIITGANVTEPDLEKEIFWKPLVDVVRWAHENVTSTLCSCLASHAILQSQYGIKRQHLDSKMWGVFPHTVLDLSHPLVSGVNTLFDVPHSRYNRVSRDQFEEKGLHVLVESDYAGVHLAVSPDGFRTVYFQGHPEFDVVSLLKEYKREVGRYINRECDFYPPFPQNYFSLQVQAIFDEYQDRCESYLQDGEALPEFPEHLVMPMLHNTWHDTGEAIVGNWIGLVYQITSNKRRKPFMDIIDLNNPIDWL